MKYYLSPEVIIQEKNDKVLFINPTNSTWLKVGPKVKDMIESIIGSKENEEAKDVLKSNIIERFEDAGILIKDAELEQNSYHNKDRINSAYLVVTKKCNLQCSFCSMSSNPEVDESNNLDTLQIKKTIDDLSKHSIRNIIVTGGEPFLRTDILEILDYLNEKKSFKISVATNGLLLNSGIIDSIAGKVTRVEISLENILHDGLNSQFMHIIEVVRKLKENNISIAFSYVMTSYNLDSILKFVDLCAQYDTGMSIKIAAPIGKGKEEVLLDEDTIYNTYKKIIMHICNNKYDGGGIQKYIRLALSPGKSCSAKKGIIAIQSDGSIYPCHSLSYPEFKIGNIVQDNFDDVIKKKNYLANTNLYKDNFDIDRRIECLDCEVKYFCRGGCRAESYNNDIVKGKMPPDCKIKKLLINFNLWDYDSKASFISNMENLISKF